MSDCLAANGLNWATTKWKQQSALLLLRLFLFWYIRWVTVAPPPLPLSLSSPVGPARACSSLAVPFPLFIILAFGNVLPTLQPARSPRLCFNFVWCITLYPPVGQPSPASAPLLALASVAFIHLQIFLLNSIQRSLATHTFLCRFMRHCVQTVISAGKNVKFNKPLRLVIIRIWEQRKAIKPKDG